ncbi:hypothetical protein G6F62_015503 [Rhizopus arrhizus]|nr:hypothetical protein G6F62_015503 [Rhizopus arrhizus]
MKTRVEVSAIAATSSAASRTETAVYLAAEPKPGQVSGRSPTPWPAARPSARYRPSRCRRCRGTSARRARAAPPAGGRNVHGQRPVR